MTRLYHGSYVGVPAPLTGAGRRELDIDTERALDLLYNSHTYALLSNPASGLNLQSDDYILTDLMHELEK